MALDEYEKKRSRAKTPEPFGKSKRRKATAEPRFVIQRHDARRLHYDLRLERDGALASWAVPKGIPLRRGERHLAVHVEDHPLEYADFEGTIPAGEYGAGTVEIWDRGTYELVEEKKNGGLTVRLRGERLDGEWTLVPAHLDGDPKNWLLLRHDEGRGDVSRYWPMLSTSTETLPHGEGWVFEPKWDGYRAIVTVAGGATTFTSRRGNDLTQRFSDCARKVGASLRSANAVLDGEIVALDDGGRSRFSGLQEGSGTLAVVVFDLLEVDGEPLVQLPLEERRRRLEELVIPEAGSVLVSPQFDDGAALLAAAKRARPRRRGREAPRLRLPAGPARRRVAEEEAAGRAGARDRRLHGGSGTADRRLRSARRRGARSRRAALGGERRHRLQ